MEALNKYINRENKYGYNMLLNVIIDDNIPLAKKLIEIGCKLNILYHIKYNKIITSFLESYSINLENIYENGALTVSCRYRTLAKFKYMTTIEMEYENDVKRVDRRNKYYMETRVFDENRWINYRRMKMLRII